MKVDSEHSWTFPPANNIYLDLFNSHPYEYIESTDKEDKDLQHWSCNTDCRVEVESPPLTMFAVKMGTYATGATIPNNAETIHSKVFLGCLSLSDKCIHMSTCICEEFPPVSNIPFIEYCSLTYLLNSLMSIMYIVYLVSIYSIQWNLWFKTTYGTTKVVLNDRWSFIRGMNV